MRSGTIRFDDLLEHVRNHPEIPHKEEGSFAQFKSIYEHLVNGVDDVPGWYAWLEPKGLNLTIVYIGQSQTRKTASLRARIREEFLDEFVALWATIWDAASVVDTLDRKYGGKYTTPIKRAARKAGADRIIWFGKPGLSDQQLDVIEHALIAKYDPRANRQKRTHTVSMPELLEEAVLALQSQMHRSGGTND
jgi:hypothetical protein